MPEFSVKKAHDLQRHLSKHIIFEDMIPERVRLVGGVDVAYANDISIAAVAVLRFDSLNLQESRTAACRTRFPYIPTLLSFREVPPATLCIQKLRAQPDLFLVDGHGYAHPYRCGFASHLGLVIGKPTIGVAKGILVGQVQDKKAEEGVAFLRHRGEIIGAQLMVESVVKPIYVSVGHMISLATAIRIVRKLMFHGGIPEPLSVAHRIANAEKSKINMSTQTQSGNR